MVDRSTLPNAFEFVVVASARAKQLLQGCVPKVDPSGKPARTAQREVLEGFVQPLYDDEPLIDPQTPLA
ncbi:MAG: DNA-directed RNA polymerase subunit omega [Acidobacteria bacterium]|nr:DNA-directed RNA polymerase subunit omega [Acidobacteriota bacterium]